MDGLEDRLRRSLTDAAKLAGQPEPPNPRMRASTAWRQVGIVTASVLLLIGLVGSTMAVARMGVFDGKEKAAGLVIGPKTVFVLDAAPNGQATNGEAVEVRTEGGTSDVVAHYPLGSDPDIVLSPDGSTLFGVAWAWQGNETKSVLRVFDTNTQQMTAEVPIPNLQGTTGFHVSSKIVIAPNGSRVFVLVDAPSESGAPSEGLAVFDVASGNILDNVALLDGCGAAPTILPLSSDRVVVVCREVGEARLIEIGATGSVASEKTVELPTSASDASRGPDGILHIGYVSSAVLTPDKSMIIAVTGDGRVLGIDTKDLAINLDLTLDLPDNTFVPVPQVRLANDGRTLLLGLGELPASSAILASGVLPVDTQTWTVGDALEVRQFSWFDADPADGTIFSIYMNAGGLWMSSLTPGEPQASASVGSVADRPTAVYVEPG
jgi:hypothetical protein